MPSLVPDPVHIPRTGELAPGTTVIADDELEIGPRPQLAELPANAIRVTSDNPGFRGASVAEVRTSAPERVNPPAGVLPKSTCGRANTQSGAPTPDVEEVDSSVGRHDLARLPRLYDLSLLQLE